MRRNLTTIGILLLLVSISVAPSINSQLISLQETTTAITEHTTSKHVEVTCIFSLLSGKKESTKQISAENARQLSTVMSALQKSLRNNSFPSTTVLERAVTKLRTLELIPKNMSDAFVKDLLSGDYGKQVYADVLQELRQKNLAQIKNKYQNTTTRAGLFNLGSIVFHSGDLNECIIISPLSLPLLAPAITGLMLEKIAYRHMQPGWLRDLVWELAIYLELPFFMSTLLPRIGFPIALILEKGYTRYIETPVTLSTLGLLGPQSCRAKDLILFTAGFVGLSLVMPVPFPHSPEVTMNLIGFSPLIAAVGSS